MNMPPELTADCRLVDRELDRQLGTRSSAISTQARRHLGECERCRNLYQWMTEEFVPAPGSAELYSKIQSRLRSSLKPVKPQASTRAVAARSWLLFLLFAFPAIAMMGLAGLRQMDLFQMAGITVVLVLGGVVVSLSLAWQMTPGSLHRIPGKVAVRVLIAGFLLATSLLFPWHAPEAFFARGWHCFRVGMAMAVPAAFLFWRLVRRGAALAITSLGGTLGAIAGLLSATVLQFTCSRQDAGHLLAWHGGVLVASSLMGILVAQAIRRVSERQP